MNNPLDEIKKIMRGLTTSKNKSIVGIDIGSSAIKVVEMREVGGKAILETYGSISLGLYKEEKGVAGEVASLTAETLSVALNDVFKEANVTTRRAALSVPSASTLVFTLTLPASVKESELKSVVPIEARRYIPVDIADVSLDWWVLPKQSFVTPLDPNKKQESTSRTVLVVAVRKDTVTGLEEVLEKSRVEKDFLEVEAFSLVRANVEHDLSTILVVDIGASRTKVVFLDGGVVRDVHVINRGGEDISQGLVASFGISFKDAEYEKKRYGLNNPDEAKRKNVSQSLDFIISELKNIIFQYEQKNGVTLDKMILSGGASRLDGTLIYLEEKLSFPVVYGDPFSQSEAPAFLSEALKDAGAEFAVAIGLCLRGLRK